MLRRLLLLLALFPVPLAAYEHQVADGPALLQVHRDVHASKKAGLVEGTTNTSNSTATVNGTAAVNGTATAASAQNATTNGTGTGVASAPAPTPAPGAMPMPNVYTATTTWTEWVSTTHNANGVCLPNLDCNENEYCNMFGLGAYCAWRYYVLIHCDSPHCLWRDEAPDLLWPDDPEPSVPGLRCAPLEDCWASPFCDTWCSTYALEECPLDKCTVTDGINHTS
mmetsp:Transcript_9361/g.16935  ORF Transcript_9361/g.16935 Transcript_9361/m.16935 type:complete len:224 (+) Transcript_9361:77-748(+)